MYAISVLLSLQLAAAIESSLPGGWWIVEAAGGKDVGSPGSAWRFQGSFQADGGVATRDASKSGPKTEPKAEIVAVDAARSNARRSELACRTLSPRVWRCERSVSVGGTRQYLQLLLHEDGQLVGTAGRDGETPYGQMTARRATAAEAAALEAMAARVQSEAQSACDRAKRCYAVACPELGQADDPCVFEHHSMSQDAASCAKMAPMLAGVLRQLGKPVPVECAESDGR
jgi:hypothetical protein